MRRLPDGTRTQNENKYLEAWPALAQPLVEALGWKLCAWDPGYLFEGPEKQTIELGEFEVKAIGTLIERLAACERVVEAARAYRSVSGGTAACAAEGHDLDCALAALDGKEA